ncbi:MAG: YdcF family protein [Lachnospiraceae bacterium]|nr:YdcF family protein [Lachnospiraceae bacterium]
MINIFLLIISVLFISYFFVVQFAGHGTSFYFIWLFMEIGSLLLYWGNIRGKILENIPEKIFFIIKILFIVIFFIFVLVEAWIIKAGFFQNAETEADYVIVLGAQMKADGPSRVLQYRLDTAITYLNENQNTKVIVSGGQGPTEPVSEAEGMYQYLLKKGIDKNRIIKEEKSTTTVENLKYSKKEFNSEKNKIVIITNNFHMARALLLARNVGIENVSGEAAPSTLALLPNNLLREFLAMVKAMMVST